MTTVGDIRDDIKSRLAIQGSEYDSLLVSSIQSALRELRGKRYWFLRSYTTLTATASSETLNITAQVSDFSVIENIDLIDGNQRYTLLVKDFNKLQNDYWQTVPLQIERPTAYAVLGGTLYLSRKCVSAYSMPMVYYKQDATIPAASESSIWFDDGLDLVRATAQYLFKRDAQGMTLQEADSDMVAMTEERLNNAHLAKTVGGFY
jgi:hypothetical protein